MLPSVLIYYMVTPGMGQTACLGKYCDQSIDCCTGEGIHHAMESGKMAAQFLEECLDHGNFDQDVMQIWHERWMDKFGTDYKWQVTDEFIAS